MGTNHNDAYNGPQPAPCRSRTQVGEFKVETSGFARTVQRPSFPPHAINAHHQNPSSNDYHGDAFEFLRNGDLNAFATSLRRPRDSLKRNQFGGTVGGPVTAALRNKLFFFAGYQGHGFRNPIRLLNISAYVPTAAELQGNFTSCNRWAAVAVTVKSRPRLCPHPLGFDE